jgi:glycosyltransferase involved in cell wall biosynthesis
MLVKDPPAAIQAELDVSLPAAIKTGKSLGLPVVADIHNITAEELVANNTLKKQSPAFKQLQTMMGNYLAQCDLVVVVSDLMREYAIENYSLGKDSVIVVPPAGNIDVPKSKNRFDDRIVYAGTVSHRERVDLFIESIKNIHSEQQLSFYITARGEELEKILGLPLPLRSRIKPFWIPNESDFFIFLSSCSIGVLTSNNDLARKMGTPLKLFDYMSVGLPFVSNDIGGWCSLIRREGVGILTDNNPMEIGNAISSLIQDPAQREEISKKQLRLVREKYNWHNSVRPLFEWYRKNGIL